MMNKKLVVLLLAIATISSPVLALFDEVVGGTFDAAERVATVPVDAIPDDRTWEEKRDERRDEREYRRDRRQAEREARRDYYVNDYRD
jgi:hypothetical protein